VIDLQVHKKYKYLLYGNLYFAQGIVQTIGFVLIPVYFTEQGISPSVISIVIGIAMIPMIIKFIWGGIVDYFIHRGRKTFVVLGTLLLSVALFILSFLNPGEALIPFVVVLLLGVCGWIFLDTSADAWAIDISTIQTRGKINGSMWTGQYLGMALGSSVLGFIAYEWGYNIAFLTAALIVLCILLLPLLTKEDIKIKKRQKMRPIIIEEFKQKNVKLVSAFSTFSLISRGMLVVIIPIFMKTFLELDIAQIGLIVALFTIFSALGSLTCGIVVDILDRKKSLYGFFGISILLTFCLIFVNTWYLFTIIYALVGFLQGGYLAGVTALYMDTTNPRIGATQFSIYSSFANFGMTGGQTVSGSLVTLFGFSLTFLYAGLIFAPVLIILHFIRLPKDNAQRYTNFQEKSENIS